MDLLCPYLEHTEGCRSRRSHKESVLGVLSKFPRNLYVLFPSRADNLQHQLEKWTLVDQWPLSPRENLSSLDLGEDSVIIIIVPSSGLFSALYLRPTDDKLVLILFPCTSPPYHCLRCAALLPDTR